MEMDLRGKRTVVVGLGRSGVAAVRHLSAAGARVAAADIKPESELRGALAEIAGLDVALSLGAHDPKLFDSADAIILSPGVPQDIPGLAAARARGVPAVGEMELALGRIERPIVAVTGTNGKTTTTSLIGHLLASCGIRACVAGNIGTPLLDAMDEARRSDVVVLEVSSFQIETTPSLEPRIAVWLNATPDHLDRHHSFDEYVACKARILTRVPRDGWGIYNAADDAVARAAAASTCRLIPFDATGGEGRGALDDGPRAWFGAGDLCVRARADCVSRYPLSAVKLRGSHNRENMLAGLAAAELSGADPARLKVALESFEPLPHRVELVGEVNGVRFYDDSKGTNVGATVKALEGFGEPVVLIAGGLSKGADFEPLARAARGRVKIAVLIGRDADALAGALSGSTDIARAGSMVEAVRMAFAAASRGDVVLLSPACASFDMFRDYAERGEAFASAVADIKA